MRGWDAHVADVHVAPDALEGQRVSLHSHVACLGQGQLQHQAAAVVCNAAHHVQPPRRSRHYDVILFHAHVSFRQIPCIWLMNGAS